MGWTYAPCTYVADVLLGLHAGPPKTGVGAVTVPDSCCLSVGPTFLTGLPCLVSMGTYAPSPGMT